MVEERRWLKMRQQLEKQQWLEEHIFRYGDLYSKEVEIFCQGFTTGFTNLVYTVYVFIGGDTLNVFFLSWFFYLFWLAVVRLDSII